MIRVFCLDTGASYYFAVTTAFQALEGMRYMLDLSHKDDSANIDMHGYGHTLSLTHSGNTYGAFVWEREEKEEEHEDD